MREVIDLRGKRFGRLLVIDIAGRYQDRQVIWKCQCDCGNIINVSGCALRNGTTRSCGCYRRDNLSLIKRKQTEYDIDRDTAICYTIFGEEFYIDSEDIYKIKDQAWHIGKNGYIYGRDRAAGKTVLLHRYLLGINDNKIIVDHKDRNPLNNKKSNLRVCTMKENQYNIGIRSNNKSGYTGVFKRGNRWVADIGVCGKLIHLGRYDNFEDAVKARFEGEKKYWGDYAPFNEKYVNDLINQK